MLYANSKGSDCKNSNNWGPKIITVIVVIIEQSDF